jgi:catechol 2,3-dioxygenase-like lactoylglutathione lyase family enzyme
VAEDGASEPVLDLARPQLDVGLVTSDVAAASSFYTDVLGFEALPGPRARLRFGAQHIELIAPRPAPARAPGGLSDGTGMRVLGLLIDDLDAVCARIRARGRRVAEGVDLPGRLRIRFARDADGNMLELIGLPEPAGTRLRDRIQIGLTVADAERSRAFYGGALGLPEQPALPMGEDMTRFAFSAGGTTLKLWQRPEPLPSFAGPPLDALGIRFVLATLRDAERTLLALRQRGLALETAPSGLAPGIAGCLVDPDGNWLVLTHPDGA